MMSAFDAEAKEKGYTIISRGIVPELVCYIEELEAKLEKAVEALKFYAYVDDDQGIRAIKILEEMGVKRDGK